MCWFTSDPTENTNFIEFTLNKNFEQWILNEGKRKKNTYKQWHKGGGFGEIGKIIVSLWTL